MPARKRTRKAKKKSRKGAKKASRKRGKGKGRTEIVDVPPTQEYRVRLGHRHAEVLEREAEKAGVAPSELLERALERWIARR